MNSRGMHPCPSFHLIDGKIAFGRRRTGASTSRLRLVVEERACRRADCVWSSKNGRVDEQIAFGRRRTGVSTSRLRLVVEERACRRADYVWSSKNGRVDEQIAFGRRRTGASTSRLRLVVEERALSTSRLRLVVEERACRRANCVWSSKNGRVDEQITFGRRRTGVSTSKLHLLVGERAVDEKLAFSSKSFETLRFLTMAAGFCVQTKDFDQIVKPRAADSE